MHALARHLWSKFACVAKLLMNWTISHHRNSSMLSGITNFDLLGNFGRLEWLGNFYIILSYNLVFAVATALCLVNKFTAPMRRALMDIFEQAFAQGRQRLSQRAGGGVLRSQISTTLSPSVKDD